jgi:hypothetical protein
MFDTTRDDDELSRPQLDDSVPELDTEATAPYEKHLFHVIVMVPGEDPLHLDQLDLLPVQLGHDLRLPLLRKLGKFLRDADTFH